MPKQWYYAQGDQKYGPIPSSELKRLATVGQLRPSDLVWGDGMETWTAASTIAGLLPKPSPVKASSASATPSKPSSLEQAPIVPQHSPHAQAHANVSPPSRENKTILIVGGALILLTGMLVLLLNMNLVERQEKAKNEDREEQRKQENTAKKQLGSPVVHPFFSIHPGHDFYYTRHWTAPIPDDPIIRRHNDDGSVDVMVKMVVTGTFKTVERYYYRVTAGTLEVADGHKKDGDSWQQGPWRRALLPDLKGDQSWEDTLGVGERARSKCTDLGQFEEDSTAFVKYRGQKQARVLETRIAAGEFTHYESTVVDLQANTYVEALGLVAHESYRAADAQLAYTERLVEVKPPLGAESSSEPTETVPATSEKEGESASLGSPQAGTFLSDAQRDDLAQMQGTWTATVVEYGGQTLPEDRRKRLRAVIKDNTLNLVLEGDSVVQRRTMVLTPSTKPKAMDVTPLAERNRVSLAIYEIDGDNLKICWREPGGTRPNHICLRAESRFGPVHPEACQERLTNITLHLKEKL